MLSLFYSQQKRMYQTKIYFDCEYPCPIFNPLPGLSIFQEDTLVCLLVIVVVQRVTPTASGVLSKHPTTELDGPPFHFSLFFLPLLFLPPPLLLIETRICCVTQAHLRLLIPLAQPPECLECRCVSPCCHQAWFILVVCVCVCTICLWVPVKARRVS